MRLVRRTRKCKYLDILHARHQTQVLDPAALNLYAAWLHCLYVCLLDTISNYFDYVCLDSNRVRAWVRLWMLLNVKLLAIVPPQIELYVAVFVCTKLYSNRILIISELSLAIWNSNKLRACLVSLGRSSNKDQSRLQNSIQYLCWRFSDSKFLRKHVSFKYILFARASSMDNIRNVCVFESRLQLNWNVCRKCMHLFFQLNANVEFNFNRAVINLSTHFKIWTGFQAYTHDKMINATYLNVSKSEWFICSMVIGSQQPKFPSDI